MGDYAPDQNSTSGYIVVSTSDFTTRPNGDFTEAEGILKSAYLDNDDNVQVKTHESIYDTEVPGILMSNHAYANPYKFDDILRDDETMYIIPEDIVSRDSDGFVIEQPSEFKGELSIAVSYTHLTLPTNIEV